VLQGAGGLSGCGQLQPFSASRSALEILRLSRAGRGAGMGEQAIARAPITACRFWSAAAACSRTLGWKGLRAERERSSVLGVTRP